MTSPNRTKQRYRYRGHRQDLKTDPTLEKARAFGHQLTTEAGRIVLDCFGNTEAYLKAPLQVVTEADAASEAWILAQIREYFPDHTVIAEETASVLEEDSEFCWVVDPLDGTSNFAAGITTFCVSIALLQMGSPILGWVLDPVRKEMFWAGKGNGAFLNNQPITSPKTTDGRVPSGLSSGLIEISDPVLLAELWRTVGKARILGSQALHLCYVASGRLRAALNWEAYLWDDAAGALIVQESGARYSDLWGRDVFPLSQDSPTWKAGPISSLAAGESLHSQLAGLFRRGQSQGDPTK